MDKDRDRLIEFLCRFIRAKSPNPPGDTREAEAHITAFLEARGLPYRIIEAHPEMPNIVGGHCQTESNRSAPRQLKRFSSDNAIRQCDPDCLSTK